MAQEVGGVSEAIGAALLLLQDDAFHLADKKHNTQELSTVHHQNHRGAIRRGVTIQLKSRVIALVS